MNALLGHLRGSLAILLADLCGVLSAQYQGTASVTQGLATTVQQSIYSCPNGRVPGIGTITASDNTTWTVPAEVDFQSLAFPLASVLYNPCTGATFSTADAALAALDGSDVVTVDPDGEVVTGFIFADNYFQLWVNGIPVGKDDVPYTQFNSNIVRFRVQRPFTIAMLLVDWEEHLGIGTEANGGFSDHAGDGGIVGVFKDASGQVIATTGPEWRAQTFYTAPILDLACPVETGALRLSSACSTQDSNDGSAYYGLHWPRPDGWVSSAFDDADWPQATAFTNAEVGVNNKPAYTNFTDVFDDAQHDASFIWSTNLVLDNEVLVRHTVDAQTAIEDPRPAGQPFRLVMNSAEGTAMLEPSADVRTEEVTSVQVEDAAGRLVFERNGPVRSIDISGLRPGLYVLRVGYRGRAAMIRFLR